MMINAILLLVSLAVPAGADQVTTQPVPSNVLATLRPGHPRLIVLDEDMRRVRALIETDPGAAARRDELQRSAEDIFDQPTVVHEVIGPRLLAQSRRCLWRVYTLATMYRLSGDERYARRAEKEMLAAAGFPDWNPSHFLDTAEMSHALGVGYDWLYGFLPPESRSTIRSALVEKGLTPGLELYRRKRWAVHCEHNWNQVCNGGLAIGALAIADEAPELAGEIIRNASELIRRPTRRLAPDGGWDEGPGYWNYAMSYTAFYLAAVRSALGTDFGLSELEGLAETGLFRIHAIGPTGLTFNYADAGPSAGNAPQMFLFARLFDRPAYAWHQRRFGNGTHPLNLLWYDPRGSDETGFSLPRGAFFRNVDVVFLRGSWQDPETSFVGFKGGDNRANHSHLDLGTFVFDALGKRWAIDLGADEYNLPGYFGDKRWTYYRLRTEGQNTLVINGENQDPKARAPIVACHSADRAAWAIADLSAAYAKQAQRVRRGVALLDRRDLLVQDEVEIGEPAGIQWAMHTTADVTVEGRTATLSLDDRRLLARILEPADGTWEVQPVEPAPPQRPTRNTRKLVLRLSQATPLTRIAVALSPVIESAGPHEPVTVRPLDNWQPD